MANTRYQLEGNAPQLYERETVHTLSRPLAELMFAHVALQAGDRVLYNFSEVMVHHEIASSLRSSP